MARLLPTHILPPELNAQNQRSCSRMRASCSAEGDEGGSQRSGFHSSGEGKTEGLRWRV
jgi:hypothetical protein